MPVIIPYGKKVLVRRRDPEDRSSGGIYFPESAQEKSYEAEVLALGTGVDEKGNPVFFNVQVGDVVLLPRKFMPAELEYKGEKYLAVNESDIMGRIEQEV